MPKKEPKKETTLRTPLDRPTALGAEFELLTPAEVNAALHELGWCQQKLKLVQSEMQELHDAVETQRPAKVALKIPAPEGDKPIETTLQNRADLLAAAIDGWARAHLKDNLPTPDDRALKLQHGTVNYRKLELSIEPQEGLDDKTVLERIEKKSKGLLTKARLVATTVIVKVLKLTLGDLVKITISLNREGMVAAYKAKQLDDKTLKSLGLVADDTREKFAFKVE